MLETLRRLVQEVSAASDLEAALDVIVKRVKHAINAAACSVYLVDKNTKQCVLMATDGLNPESVRALRVPLGAGLIGLVHEREEPVNVDDAREHPRFQWFPNVHEEEFHAFLGVPIIHRRSVMGILVVRHKVKRRFHDDEEALLITVASQLAGAIAHAETSGDVARLLRHHAVGERSLDGLPGAPGVVVGTALISYPSADLDAVPDRTVADPEEEIRVFDNAIAKTRADLQRMAEQLSELAAADRALFDAYLMMLDSDSIVGKTRARIRGGSWASGALRDTIREHVRMFDEMEDPYMRERASDVRDLGTRILMAIQSGERKAPPYPDKTILVGEEVTATMLAEVPRDRLAGVVSVRGSSLSHVSILAHAMGIPAVVGVRDLPVSRVDHCEMVVDGYRGRLYISPTRAVKNEYLRLAREEEELAAGLEELRSLAAETVDGVRIPLYANTGLISDLIPSLNSGAEGIGLYRTEFPFLIRDRFPSEEEQRHTYRQILEAFQPRPVILRTLDIGGDKSLPYFPIAEDNPFLGWRGIRVTLDHPEIFLVQVRAMLKGSAGFENLQILLPMITSVGEVDEALTLIHRAYNELVAEGVKLSMPKIGVMIEVPSAIHLIDAFAKRVDFFSIGTNDLTQYMLAVDRNNSRVAGLYDSLHPSVLSAVRQIIESAHRNSKTVSVCGEMAGDPAAVISLLGLKVDSLSMSVSSLSRVKWVIRNISFAEAKQAVAEALKMDSAADVRAHLDAILDKAGMGGLIRAGKS